jgi:hypothetical protein
VDYEERLGINKKENWDKTPVSVETIDAAGVAILRNNGLLIRLPDTVMFAPVSVAR